MHTGMLWFDDSKIPLISKVNKAVEYYKKKYGRTPDLVLVHPSMMEDFDKRNESVEVSGLSVRPYRSMLPGHIWIGMEDVS